MKKITAIIIAAMMLAGTTANAAWEFDEKVLAEAKYGVLSTRIEDEVIKIDEIVSWQTNSSLYGRGHFDLNGNKLEITYPSYSSLQTQTNTIKEKNYFTNNRKSYIENDSGYILKDLVGNILASGFEPCYGQNYMARKVKNDNGYGVMAYDGRIIIPMKNEETEVCGNDIYTATNNDITEVYNYDGELLFKLAKGLRIERSHGWFAITSEWMGIRDRNSQKVAIINYNGEYLTDFEYDDIKIYTNNEQWQSGMFVELRKGNAVKYLDGNLSEINIFSEEGVYCEKYSIRGDVVVINNYTGWYTYNSKSALYNKNTREYILPFRDGNMHINNLFVIYTNNGLSQLYDHNGNYIKDLKENVYSISEFKDGIADVSGNTFCYDLNFDNIFSKTYKNVKHIDNNEFLVIEDNTAKILTAKGIIGEALYTDVKIDINGVQIPCRSIYGYAGVVAEDLRNFGFDVIWDEEKRLLNITRNPDYYDITPMEYEADGVSGEHYANIYGSDINVEYNGKRISSYCIDGRTIIKPEDLAADGITFNYDDSVRTLFMSVDGLERK